MSEIWRWARSICCRFLALAPPAGSRKGARHVLVCHLASSHTLRSLCAASWFVAAIVLPEPALAEHEKKRVEVKHPAEYRVETRYREERVEHQAEYASVTRYREETVSHPAKYRTETRYREEQISHPAEYGTVTRYREQRIEHPAEYRTETRDRSERGRTVSYQERVLVRPAWTEIKRVPYEERVLVRSAWSETKRVPYEERVLIEPARTENKRVPYEERVLVKPARTEIKRVPYEERVLVKPEWTEVRLEPVPHQQERTRRGVPPLDAENALREARQALAKIEAERKRLEAEAKKLDDERRTRLATLEAQAARAREAIEENRRAEERQRRSLTRYGNWCGKGWSGGAQGNLSPVDRVDAACYKHDTAYSVVEQLYNSRTRNLSDPIKFKEAEITKLKQIAAADEELLRNLRLGDAASGQLKAYVAGAHAVFELKIRKCQTINARI